MREACAVASEKRKTSGKKGKTPRNENARAIDAAVHASANFCTEMDEFAAKLDYKMASSVKPIACTTIPTLVMRRFCSFKFVHIQLMGLDAASEV